MSSIGVLECVGGLAVLAGGGTACALCFFSDAPLEGDYRAGYSRQWQTGMLEAPAADPFCCCAAIWCAPCTQYQLRMSALDNNVAAYRCCQGYFDLPPCWRAGMVGDEGNSCCLIVEALICPSLAVQATRLHMMDTRNIAPSPTDNKLTRFSNALQVLACLCTMCDCPGDDLARCAADLVFTTLVGCMSAQVAAELKAEASGKTSAPQPGMSSQPFAPQPMAMARNAAQAGAAPGACAYPMAQPVGGYPGQQQHVPVAQPMVAAPQAVVMGRPVQNV